MKGFDKTSRSDENGRMKKQHVQLSPADRDYLKTLTRQGEQTAKAYRRALALLELDRGKTYTEVSKILRATIQPYRVGQPSTLKMA